ncbi:MAG: tetratricopeptide repeat protein [Azospirillaceae bacterium]
MATAVESEDEDKPPPFEREFKRLKRLALRTGRLRLGLATYDTVPTRTKTIDRLRQDLESEGHQLLVADLTDGNEDTIVLDEIEAALERAEPDKAPAVMVIGLESLIDFTQGGSRSGSTDALFHLNLHRDTLGRRTPVPIVIWASPEAMRTLAHTAPDLWHWRVGTFQFAKEDARETRARELLENLIPELETTPEEKSPAELHKRRQMFRELIASSEKNVVRQSPQSYRQAVWMRRELGNIEYRLNDTDRAAEAYGRALELGRDWQGSYPDDERARRDISISLDHIGDLRHDRGDLSGAEAAFVESLEIARFLADRNPDNTQAQRDLSVSLNNIGDLRRDRGDLPGAEAAFAESLEVRRALADRDPEGIQARRDLAIGLSLLGILKAQLGHFSAAQEALFECREILLSLEAQGDPWPALEGFYTSVNSSLEEIAAALAAQKNPPAAGDAAGGEGSE